MSRRAPDATTRHKGRGPIIPPAPPPKKLAGLALNERLVRERDRDRARELVRLLALGVAVLLPLLAHVWQQVAFVESAYRAEELRSDSEDPRVVARELGAEIRAQRELRELRRFGDADARRLRVELALRLQDVGTALEQIGRQSCRNLRRKHLFRQ